MSEKLSDTTSVYSISSSFEVQSVISCSSSTFRGSRRGHRRRRRRKAGRKEGYSVLDPNSSNQDRTPRPLGSVTRARIGKGNHPKSGLRSPLGPGSAASGSIFTQPLGSATASTASQTSFGSIQGGVGYRSMVDGHQRRDSISSLASGIASSGIGPFGGAPSTTSEDVHLSSSFADEEEETPYLPSGLTGISSQFKFPVGEGEEVERGEEEMYMNERDGREMDAATVREEEGEVLTEDEVGKLMKEDFPIRLIETSTMLVFERFQESISDNDPKIREVKEDNRKFHEKVERKIQERHYFSEKGIQTIEVFRKNKYTDKPTKDVEEKDAEVKEYEIYDCYEKIRKEKEAEEKRLSHPMPGGGQEGNGEDDDEEDEDEDVWGDEDDVQSSGGKSSERGSGDVFGLHTFRDSLTVLERLVVQNQNESRVRSYLQSTITNDDQHINNNNNNQDRPFTFKKEGQFRTLWRYETDLVTGMEVNRICYNTLKTNIHAAIYGNLDFVSREDAEGYVLCWNLKNIQHPERVIKIENMCPISCDFSVEQPNLLAVGFNEGSIRIYDVRTRGDKPVLESMQTHSSSVWDLKWVKDHKTSGAERLHSCGNDGRVKNWSITKGLVGTEIMRLRRVGKMSQNRRTLSRECGGMALDFYRPDPTFYLVGTETGAIVKCSTTYNEQYVKVYEGHKGPVYKVKYSPKDPNRFISCSADWTVKVWNEGSCETESASDSSNESVQCLEYSIEPYNNVTDEKEGKKSYCILDIDWNPLDDSVFAYSSITGDVHWIDSKFSLYHPRIKKKFKDIPSSIIFVPNSNILTVGDCNGRIHVLKPHYPEKKKE